ncbi:rho GTPase-activating protein 12-like, partial [Tropilaelaps mercedesae]
MDPQAMNAVFQEEVMKRVYLILVRLHLNSLRSLKTRSMILSDLDWRSKSVDIISGLHAVATTNNGGQGTHQGVHVLSVQKLPNLADIEETVKRQ